MLEKLLRVLGVSNQFIEHLDQAVLAFQQPRVLWVGLVLLVPVSFLIYRRQDRNLAAAPRGLKVALSMTRVLILAILMVVLAGPYLKIDERVEKKPLVAVLVDDSRSMQLPAGPFESDEEIALVAQAAGYDVGPDEAVTAEVRKAVNQLSRADLVRAVLESGTENFIEPVAADYEVRYFAFSDSLVPLVTDTARPEIPELPETGAGSTRMGEVLNAVLDEVAGQAVAGIVLFSDGQHTGGLPPLEAAEAAAKAGAPIFPVAPGSSTRLQDLSIVDVFTCGLISVGDTAKVTVTLESQGLDGQSVEVQLLDGEEILDSKSLFLRGAEQQRIELSFKASQPGTLYLKVNIPPLPEESEELHANNSDMAVVRVSGKRLKVLFIDGLPRWDFRFLKNSLRRDPGLAGRKGDVPEIVLEAEARRQSAEAGPVLPGTVEGLAEYDVVIAGDASPRLLDTAFLGLLDDAVRNHGVGLIVAAGPSYMPHVYGPLLQELLPVQMHHEAAGMMAPPHKPFRLDLSPEGSMHEVMRLYEDTGRNESVWGVMPPYYWCAAADRPAPAATVLAWNPDLEVRYGRVPLIAFHFAGEGKVMFVGLDSTWHWRQNVGERFFYKFWGQAIRFVAQGEAKETDSGEGAPKRDLLEVRPVRVAPDREVTIELTAYDAVGAPRTDEPLTVDVLGPDVAEKVVLAPDGVKAGQYAGAFRPSVKGDYRLTWTPDGDDEAMAAHFQVLDAPEELRHPNINRALLQQIAAASGGEMIDLGGLAAIPDKLKGEAKLTEVHREATIWDNWLTLLVLMSIYSLDVGLRRLKGLA